MNFSNKERVTSFSSFIHLLENEETNDFEFQTTEQLIHPKPERNHRIHQNHPQKHDQQDCFDANCTLRRSVLITPPPQQQQPNSVYGLDWSWINICSSTPPPISANNTSEANEEINYDEYITSPPQFPVYISINNESVELQDYPPFAISDNEKIEHVIVSSNLVCSGDGEINLIEYSGHKMYFQDSSEDNDNIEESLFLEEHANLEASLVDLRASLDLDCLSLDLEVSSNEIGLDMVSSFWMESSFFNDDVIFTDTEYDSCTGVESDTLENQSEKDGESDVENKSNDEWHWIAFKVAGKLSLYTFGVLVFTRIVRKLTRVLWSSFKFF